VADVPGIEELAEVASADGATTYTGRDAESGDTVVVTVLHREATEEVRARFDYDQAQAAELGSHPSLRRVLRHGYTTDGHAYVVSEHVAGESLSAVVEAGVDGPTVVNYGVRLAGAIDSAHRVQVCHGDLRPEDIVVDEVGEPRLGGLGIVTVTGHGPAQGEYPARLAHAAPEQLRAEPPSPAADVYSLGSVLFSLLSGGDAFVQPEDTSVISVLKRIAGAPLPDLREKGVPDPIAAAIERAMQRAPEDRWASAEEFGQALQQAEATLGLPVTELVVNDPDELTIGLLAPAIPRQAPVTAARRAAARPRRSPRRRILGAAAVLAVVAAIVAVVALAGGGDDDGGGGGDEEPLALSAADLDETSDDLEIITVGVPDRWRQRDGAFIPNGFNSGENVPDLVVAANAAGFLSGLGTPGIRVTVMDTAAVSSVNGVDASDAGILIDTRVTASGQLPDGATIESSCSDDGSRDERTVAGLVGSLQRFAGCTAGARVYVFGGSDGERSMIVEVHFAPDDDEREIDLLLDAISVDGVP
jgi:hypothetical protein